MAGGLYGFGSSDGSVPSNWAGHNPLPTFFRDDSLGSVDPRPVHMRSGFFPDHFSMDNALGEFSKAEKAKYPQLVLVPVQSLGEVISDKLTRNPYLTLGFGVLAGIVIAHFLSKGKK